MSLVVSYQSSSSRHSRHAPDLALCKTLTILATGPRRNRKSLSTTLERIPVQNLKRVPFLRHKNCLDEVLVIRAPSNDNDFYVMVISWRLLTCQLNVYSTKHIRVACRVILIVNLDRLFDAVDVPVFDVSISLLRVEINYKNTSNILTFLLLVTREYLYLPQSFCPPVSFNATWRSSV
jgi:hypothetical protein